LRSLATNTSSTVPLFYSLNHVLRVMLHTHWSAEAWSQVRVEFKKALALLSEIRRAGWFN